MKCSVCGSEYHSKFCPSCGANQPEMQVCARCGEVHGYAFCPQCGTSSATLAYCEEGAVQQEVMAQPQQVSLAQPQVSLTQPQVSYPPAGTYPPPPPPVAEVPAQTQYQTLAAPAGGLALAGVAMPAITVNTTSLTGDANTVITLAAPQMGAMALKEGQKSKLLTFFLCFFFGFLGVHRFYTGKIGTGLLWLFTGAMFSVGWFVDLAMILAGSFRDANGLPLKI